MPATHSLSDPAPSGTESWNSILDGAVRFVQPVDGYRVNQDSLLLASFASRGRRAELGLDLGAGVGVVGLLLHRLGAVHRVALVERDPSLAEFSERNLRASRVPGEVWVTDLASGLPRALERAATLVVMNPPFFEAEKHLPRDVGRRGARHGALAPFLMATKEALAGSRARAALAYPATRISELFDLARTSGLTPKRLRLVHAFASQPARLALVELRLERPAGMIVDPPLIEWVRPGLRTTELNAQVSDRK